MMQRNQYDACVTSPGSLAAISQHGYSYSMAVGDAWRVTVPVWRYVKPPIDGYVTDYIGGTVYNYGIGKANYPVPATLKHTVCNRWFDRAIAYGDMFEAVKDIVADWTWPR